MGHDLAKAAAAASGLCTGSIGISRKAKFDCKVNPKLGGYVTKQYCNFLYKSIRTCNG